MTKINQISQIKCLISNILKYLNIFKRFKYFLILKKLPLQQV